jgi:hypothetical protein
MRLPANVRIAEYPFAGSARGYAALVQVQETANAVKEVGPDSFILATDLGQTGNPSPADGLQLFVTELMKAGLNKDAVVKMGREVTGKLLMG